MLDVELDDGRTPAGRFPPIDEERLQALDGAALGQLSAEASVPVYMALASLSHFRDLIQRKNRRRAASR